MTSASTRVRQHLPGRRTLIAGLVGLLVGLAIAGAAWWFLVRDSSSAQAATPTSVTRTVAAGRASADEIG